MKIKVFIPKGIKFDETIDYAVITNTDGEFAIMNNHVPMITNVKQGYIKIISDKNQLYIFVKDAVVFFENQEIKCYSLNAEIGKTKEDAKSNYIKTSNESNQLSKGEDIDYSKLERELRESIMSAKAGHI